MERHTDEREGFAWGVLWTIIILAAAIVSGAYYAWYKPTHPGLRVDTAAANATAAPLGIATTRFEARRTLGGRFFV